MAKWNFSIVGASFIKELIPVDGDVDYRSQSFMQPSFDLEGDKIVMKESGQYKTAINFSQIGEIDGVEPTDLQDAYEKLLVLVENFNGGGGTPGTTPTFQDVLLEGGRGQETYNTSRDFIPSDVGKTLTPADNDLDLTLNDASFGSPRLCDSLEVCNAIGATGCRLIFDYSANVYYNGAQISDYTLNIGDKVKLTVFGFGLALTYELGRDVSGGSVDPADLISSDSDNALELGTDDKLFVPTSVSSNKLEYYAFLTYDAGNPATPIVVEDVNDFGEITASFDNVAGQIILTSSGLFSGRIYSNCPNILTPLSEPPETASIFIANANTIVIQFYNSTWSSFPDWFSNSGFPFWVKLEKFI